MSINRTFNSVAQLIVFMLAEYWLYTSYVRHDANFHWFTHFFAGTSLALVLMSVYVWVRRVPVRFPLFMLLAGHVLAMLPDLFFQAFDIAHKKWMDVFVLHISSHFIPGGNVTWYVIFLACLAVYLYALYISQVSTTSED